MTGTLAEIWRHPVKAHGRERIFGTRLEAGRALPWDRVWAVAHERSHFDPESPAWAPPGNFSRGATTPKLQQVEVTADPDSHTLTFRHPDLAPLTITADDDEDGRAFIQWIEPISDRVRLQPSKLVRAPDDAMTDTGYPSISLINLASHRALEQHLGQTLSPLRWRGNFLIEGLAPWEEMDWPGQSLRIGNVELEVVEPIKRCRMTEANPETGERDAETLKGLTQGFGHQNCGIYLKVTKGGDIQEGMALNLT